MVPGSHLPGSHLPGSHLARPTPSVLPPPAPADTPQPQPQRLHLALARHPEEGARQRRQRRALPAAAQELLAGFAAGAANVGSGYPFDTVKVRLQSSAPGQYRGAVHCLREVVRKEGVRRGLFRGLSSPLVGGTAETGVNYLVYSRVLEALRPAGSAPGSPAPLASVAAAGGAAGVALSFILGPTELVKCRMQQEGSAARYPGGPLQCLRSILATEGGLRGLARGLGATMAREVPGNALFFAAYEGMRRSILGARSPAAAPRPSSSVGMVPEHMMPQPGGDDARSGAPRAAPAAPPDSKGRHGLTEAAVAAFCGGAAGTIMWAAVLPIDVAKTRLQTAGPGSKWDVGLRKHWSMLWREGGMASLYAGLAPTLLRAFPANACQWLAWELVLGGLQGGREGDV